MMLCGKAYARVTLALDIEGTVLSGPYRGFHRLRVVKHQVDLADEVKVESAQRMEIRCEQEAVPRDSRNLCWRAVESLRDEFGIEENVRITLVKRIPMQGGLAGGSADAAEVLRLCNEFWHLGLNTRGLAGIGRRIGMDIPFGFTGFTALDIEADGEPEPVDTRLELVFVLLFPPFGVSTPAAYEALDYAAINRNHRKTSRMIDALERDERDVVVEMIHNDFEPPVFGMYPRLSEYAHELQRLGCARPFLSGSGSTLGAVVEDEERGREIVEAMKLPGVVVCTRR
jgi:4-diphosphocytidyl-2-C-methyl-D-erythritol kinase